MVYGIWRKDARYSQRKEIGRIAKISHNCEKCIFFTLPPSHKIVLVEQAHTSVDHEIFHSGVFGVPDFNGIVRFFIPPFLSGEFPSKAFL
jgi:hypothetical protein